MINPLQSEITRLQNKIKLNRDLLADPELGLLAKKEIEIITKQIEQLEKAGKQVKNKKNRSYRFPKTPQLS